MSKKLRNRLIALFCLLVFAAAGFLFYTNWVVQRPFAIILFIGDGLTTGMLAPARIYNDGAQSRLDLERLPHLALLTTYANDFAVPDAAAAASALATGRKVNNRVLSLDASGKPLTSLVDLAQKSGRSIGLVSNASLTDATLAAFYAKTPDPLDHQSIAAQLVAANLDLILGGGSDDFLPEAKEGRRTDGRDLVLEFRTRGYDIVRDRNELLDIPAWRAPRVFGVFRRGNLDFADIADRDGAQPSLADLVREAIARLQYNPKGYLLVVDAGLIAKASHSNEGERTLREIVELDRAVGAALNYAGNKALVIVTGKQSIGGLRMNGYPFKNDRGMSVIGISPQTLPFITWSTGPGGSTPKDAASPDQPQKSSEPAAVSAPAAIGVAEDVISVSTGPGSENLQGFKDNTDVFRTISENL
ncbi:MAG: alkaline phosphatase [Terrimicrobiaceae bacterium]|nr:alkaline phosphatase [Terrimicrobiaceae bacterium]